MFITLNETSYEMCTTLRLSYELQKDFGNIPYQEIFAMLRSTKLEDQIKGVYTSFRILNKDIMSYKQFELYLLDNWTLHETLEVLSRIIRIVSGKTEEEIDKEDAEDIDAEKKAQED